jgi:phosphomannomutase
MKSISGIRGVVGTSLTPSVIVDAVLAFAVVQKARSRTVVLGRDSRVSGPWVSRLVESTLSSRGVHVVNIGVVPTPTVQFIVLQGNNEQKGAKDDNEQKNEEKCYCGGIVVTSSHNPVEWNGLKFIDDDGLFLSPDRCAQMFQVERRLAAELDALAPLALYDALGSIVVCDDAAQRHIDAILALDFIDVEAIRARRFRVVLDAVNGAGGAIMSALLRALGAAEVIGLNLEPSGLFAHPPEPVGEHLQALCAAVREHGADLGVAVDPDVDRCVLIDERGEPLGEEYTLALAVRFMLAHCGRRGVVCKNLSTSRAVDDVVAQFDGCSVLATPVGEIHVAKCMVECGAVVGGEGNGGVMLPDIHIGRDAPVAAALTLQHLVVSKCASISALKATLPQYEIAKLKAPLNRPPRPPLDPDAVLVSLERQWREKGARISTADGLRIDTDDWWVHLRKSNTEPILRVIGEGGNLEQSTRRCQEFLSIIENWDQQ